jgi:hypothetical protein
MLSALVVFLSPLLHCSVFLFNNCVSEGGGLASKMQRCDPIRTRPIPPYRHTFIELKESTENCHLRADKVCVPLRSIFVARQSVTTPRAKVCASLVFFPCIPLVNNQLQLSFNIERSSLLLQALRSEAVWRESFLSKSRMPQLDKFTYFTQFFWSCLFLFTFYIPICNDGNGVLGISRILKLRNQLLSHRGNNILRKDPNSLEDILRKGFSTGVSYMYSSLFEVSQWCKAVDLLGKRKKITLISCFGEISCSRGMERNIFYLISKSSYSTSSNPGWGITCRNDIMLIHVPHGQGSIVF